MPPAPRSRLRHCVAATTVALAVTLAVTLAVPLVALPAQDAYPVVEVRQITGTGGSSWASSARVSLDRDAFVVVFEIGVDGRARLIHPASPRDDAYMRADRNWYVPLPSVDAMFVQANSMRTPTLVAFASDVAPDLSAFTSTGRSWDFMFSMPSGAGLDMANRELATLLFGDPDMPYSVSESRFAPVIPLAAQRALTDCGYRVGAYGSAQFMDFLWDLFGPFANLGVMGATLAPWRTTNFVQAFDFPFGIYGNFSPIAFTRFTSSSLWNRFGANCQGLQRLGFNQIAVINDQLLERLRSRARPLGDVPRGPGGTVDSVGITLAPNPGMERRAGRLRAATSAAEAVTGPEETLTRETNRDLLQRAEVRALVARLAFDRAMGAPTVAMNEASWNALRQAPIGRATSGSVFRGFSRDRGSGSGSSGVGSDVGSSSEGSSSGGSSSAGSAGSSSTGRSSGGRSSSGRSGSGRGNPFQ